MPQEQVLIHPKIQTTFQETSVSAACASLIVRQKCAIRIVSNGAVAATAAVIGLIRLYSCKNSNSLKAYFEKITDNPFNQDYRLF